MKEKKPTKSKQAEQAALLNLLRTILPKVAPDAATYRDAGEPGAPLADLASYHYRLMALAANKREVSKASSSCTVTFSSRAEASYILGTMASVMFFKP